MRRGLAPLAIAAAAIVTLARPVRAIGDDGDDDDDEPELVKMKFAERSGNLTVSTSIAQLFDRKAYDALGNGFPSTVVIRMWVYDKKSSEPIAFQLLQRRVVYDIWDEIYTVRVDGPGGRKTTKVKERSKAFTLLTSLEVEPLAPLTDVPYETHHVLAMVAELNPVSKETLAEVRRWLSQGTGDGLDRGGSFFGSFVSVFVNPKVAEADRVLRIRSQPFYRPTPKADQ
jgi:hypothetical protein